MKENKSLEQLENNIWPDVEFPTGLIEQCYKFRKIPIKDLTVEQLRILIGQNIGVEFLLPKVFDILKSDILAEGDYYPGDLLAAVIGIEDWHNPNSRNNFKTILQQNIKHIQNVGENNKHRQLLKQIRKFLTI